MSSVRWRVRADDRVLAVVHDRRITPHATYQPDRRYPLKAVAKDPAEVLDFTFDLTNPLTVDDDTITTHTVTAPTGITKDSDSATDTAVTAWFSGGTHGVDYPVVYQAVTVGGRTYERTIEVRVRNR